MPLLSRGVWTIMANRERMAHRTPSCPQRWIFPHLYSRQMKTVFIVKIKGTLKIDNRRRRQSLSLSPIVLAYSSFLLTIVTPHRFFISSNGAPRTSPQQSSPLGCQSPCPNLVLSYPFLCFSFPTNSVPFLSF